MLLLGGPRSGKTSTANTILGDEVFDGGTETTHSNVGHTEIYGRRVTVVDTPPWAIPADPADDAEADNNDNAGAESDSPRRPPPSLDSEGPCMGAILCPPGPHAILLVVSVTQPFTETERRAAEEQLGALGGGTWRYSMVLFTGIDKLPKGFFIEEHIANTGEALQWLVERCGSRYNVSLLSSRFPQCLLWFLKRYSMFRLCSRSLIDNPKGNGCRCCASNLIYAEHAAYGKNSCANLITSPAVSFQSTLAASFNNNKTECMKLQGGLVTTSWWIFNSPHRRVPC